MSIFNKEASKRRIGKEDFASGPSVSMGERFGAEYDLFASQSRFASSELALKDAYQNDIDQIKTVTGRSLENPLRAPNRQAASIRQGFKEASDIGRTRDANIASYWEEVGKLRDEGLLSDGVALSPEEIKQRVKEERQEERDEVEDIRERSTGIGTEIAGFAGTAASAALDPPVLASMVLGAPGSAGVLRTALVEAGIGIGTETLIQAEVQSSRPSVGEEPSLSEAVENIAFAGAGGFVLGGVAKGIGAAYRNLTGKATELRSASPEVKDAVDEVEQAAQVIESTPGTNVKQHVENLDEAVTAVSEGRKPNIKNAGEVTVRPERAVDLLRGKLHNLDKEQAQTLEGAAEEFVDETYRRQSKTFVEKLVEQASDEQLGKVLRSLRSPVQAQDLKAFVRSNGGVSFDEVGRTGRPSKLEAKGGQPLATMLKEVKKAGFPIQTKEALLKAIRGSSPVMRKGQEGALRNAQLDQDIRTGLRELGVDARANKTPQALRNAIARAKRNEQLGHDAATLERIRLAEPSLDPDELADAQFRLLTEDANPRVFLEDELGNVRLVKANDIVDESKEFEDSIAAIQVCITGNL